MNLTSVISNAPYVNTKISPSLSVTSPSSYVMDSPVIRSHIFETVITDVTTKNQSESSALFPPISQGTLSSSPESTRLDQFIQKNKDNPNIYLLKIKSLLQLVPDNGYPEDIVLHTVKNTSTDTLHDIWRDNANNVHYACSKYHVNYAFCQPHWMLSWDSISKHFTYYKEQGSNTWILIISSSAFRFSY